jgi:hypothetical protein
VETKRKNATKTRGRPFGKGNPGRPKGARHKTTVAIEALFDGEAVAITRKAIEQALGGDSVALRLCLERICPPRKERPVSLALPRLETAADGPKAIGAIVRAVSEGEITPGEAHALSGLVETFRRTLETEDLESRLAALEAK